MNLGAESRKGFVTGGTWCADHNKLVERWPKEEEVVEIIGGFISWYRYNFSKKNRSFENSKNRRLYSE